MATAACRGELLEKAYGSGKPGLNLDNLRMLKLPLPPLAEQHRIVAKVDELMALCDDLEAQLAFGASTRAQLLEATLAEALGRDGSPSRPRLIDGGGFGKTALPTTRESALPIRDDADLGRDLGRDRSPSGPNPDRGAFGERALPTNIPQAIRAHMQPGVLYSRADITEGWGSPRQTGPGRSGS